MKGMIERPEQTFAVEHAAARDQCRSLLEQRRNPGERADDIGIGLVRR